MAQMDGAVSYCFWEICSKNTGLQGSTLSGPRMTTGFGPFELPTKRVHGTGSEIHAVVCGPKIAVDACMCKVSSNNTHACM